MPPMTRKILLVLGALLIASAITYYPWTLLDRFPGSAGYAYFLSAVIWAPSALLIGLGVGFVFPFLLWPRKPVVKPPETMDRARFEA